jgi:uncharacterized protein (TIGR02246 family)
MRTYLIRTVPLVLVAALAAAARGDEKAVREFVAAYVEAFNQQDLKAVTAMWAESAAHTDRETGQRTEGRDAIAADIAEAFKTQPKAKLAGHVDRVRMIKADVASVEGQVGYSSPDEEPSLTQFSAIVINEGGKWLLASIEEATAPRPMTAYDALQELEFLVGHWVDDAEGVRVDTTFRWSANRAFLLRSFVVQVEEGVAQEGTQVIGWDPRSQEIRSWSFNSDGSFGDGVWSKSGNEWLIKSSQTLADGDAASGTYVLTRIDGNTVTLKLIGHEIEGEPQPASEVVKIVRASEDKPAANEPVKPSAPAPANKR